ncbi:mannose-P-dolichol utilization defect 1 protein-like protein 2-like [Gossypium australe]|uniref:Mannose-P-dolichol utilization defect 1 protein-like protein 2-like n=1 Tax=Gossypium australe TaxID=47621 RepID=A0A5B6X3L9_9ROSI|nr:mannose-P-dolichol utilization defect 1 protein-like protein 2-like [Gossypium australe]
MDYLGIDLSCAIGSLKDGNFPPKDCLLPLISKLLGYAIVAASTTVKLPQILKIVNHKSVRGLSLIAFELEVVGYTIALAYCLHNGLPFSAYGELVFLLIQALILVAVIYYYSKPVGIMTWIRALLYPACFSVKFSFCPSFFFLSAGNIYCAVAPTILAGQIDPILFEALYASQHAIFFFARVPQIWKNFSKESVNLYLIYILQPSLDMHKALILVILVFAFACLSAHHGAQVTFLVCNLAIGLTNSPSSFLTILHIVQNLNAVTVITCKNFVNELLFEQNKSTGELSFLTCLMNVAGSLGSVFVTNGKAEAKLIRCVSVAVRVFTSLQEKAPAMVLLGSVLGIATNGAVLSQIILYWNSQVPKEKKAE